LQPSLESLEVPLTQLILNLTLECIRAHWPGSFLGYRIGFG
jgi:hypothetical protein